MIRKWFLPIFLAVVFVSTNAWWAYSTLDAGISYTYLNDSLEENKAALSQVLALIPYATKSSVSKDKIISVAQQAHPFGGESFEKDGYVWVGSIGLKFNQKGKLIEVIRSWEQ